MADAPETSPTLLHRLGQPATDQAAWAEFVRRYGPAIHGWARQWRLQDADAEEVTQTVLIKLAQRLKAFHYDRSRGSFRGWLRTLTHHAWHDLVTARRAAECGSGDSGVLAGLAALPARDDLVQRLGQAFDREVLEEATFRVRRRVEAQTWEAYRLLAEEQLPGPAVAHRLGLSVPTVYVAKKRVLDALRAEVRKLEADEAAP
jgi:RNA polymerase sigma-70 factor (ECF subfamily)